MNSSSTQIITIENGNNILTEGNRVTNIYCLLDGRIGIWKNNQKLLVLDPQHIIGLEGIYDAKGKYPYTAQADSSCRLAVYSASDALEVFFSVPRIGELAFKSLSKQLSTCWQKLGQSNTSNIPYFSGEIKTYEADDLVIREGDHSTEMYRIISTDDGLEVSQNKQVLTVLKQPGEFFGEMASIMQEPRTATIRSLGNSVLEVYPAEVIKEVMTDYPDFALRLITTLSKRLAETSKRLSQG